MMNNQGFSQKDLADFMQGYAHYYQLKSYFPQMDNKNERLKEYYTEPYWKSRTNEEWLDIDVYIVNQTWSSTACGWGGIGGAAFSSKYNFIVKQAITDLLYVYWDGKLAYIIPAEEVKEFHNLPSITTKKAIYTNTSRR